MRTNLFLISILFFSCNHNETIDNSALTQKDIEEIINVPYSDYLDSTNRSFNIFESPAILKDTVILENLVKRIAGIGSPIIIYEPEASNNRSFQLDSAVWDDSKIDHLELIDSSGVDSLWHLTYKDHYNPKNDLYAITLPYQPFSIRIAVMQEFYMVDWAECRESYGRVFFFKEVNQKWTLIQTEWF